MSIFRLKRSYDGVVLGELLVLFSDELIDLLVGERRADFVGEPSIDGV